MSSLRSPLAWITLAFCGQHVFYSEAVAAEMVETDGFEASGVAAADMAEAGHLGRLDETSAKAAETEDLEDFEEEVSDEVEEEINVAKAGCDEYLTGRGKDYRGCQTHTRSGKLCQAWASQSPHRHSRTPSRYPDAGLEKNFCRNPDNEPSMWCYTATKTRWEYCNPLPKDPNTNDATECVSEVGGGWDLVRRTEGSTFPYTDNLVGTAIGGERHDAPLGKAFAKKFDDDSYNQFLFTTGDCSRWMIMNKFDVLGVYNNEERKIVASHRSSAPYSAKMYRRASTDGDPLISFLDHDDCSSLYQEGKVKPECASGNLGDHYKGLNVFIRQAPCNERVVGFHGSGYLGCQDKSRGGRTCQKWSSQSPHKHSMTPERQPGSGVGDHNYCRNPSSPWEKGPWCYTMSGGRWDYCKPLPQRKPVSHGVMQATSPHGTSSSMSTTMTTTVAPTCSRGVCSKGQMAFYFGDKDGHECRKLCDAGRELVPEKNWIKEERFQFKQNGLFQDVSGRLPDLTNYVQNINYKSTGGSWPGWNVRDHFYFRWTGYIEIKKAGKYTFYTISDDGSRLNVDGAIIVDNQGWHGMREKSGVIELAAGRFPFWAEAFEGGGGAGMEFKYQGPDTNSQKIIVPESVLSGTLKPSGNVNLRSDWKTRGPCVAYSASDDQGCIIYTGCDEVDVKASSVCGDTDFDMLDGLHNYKTCKHADLDMSRVKKDEEPPAPPANLSWQLVMKTNGDKTFGFSSAYWTNDKLLNEESTPSEVGNAKYITFTSIAFSKVRMCVGDASKNCVEHVFGKEYNNAQELFKSGYIRDTSVDQSGILGTFGPAKGSYQDCPMQRPGFNIQCNDGNKARWGYCNNCPSQGCQPDDHNDADGAIGLGIDGQSTEEMGAGWTNYFASGAGTCDASSKTATSKNVWFYVYGPPLPQQPTSWSLVMKTNGDGRFGFSSKYWTNDALINEKSPPGDVGNAKYPGFLSTPVNKMRMCVGKPDDNCVEHKFTRIFTSAKALFNAGYIRDETVDQAGILKAFGPAKGSYQDCGMQRPGFNIECRDGNKARWGYCNNIPKQSCQVSDNQDADAAIGLGLDGQRTDEMGAGWTNYFASNSPNSKTPKQVWLYVQR